MRKDTLSAIPRAASYRTIVLKTTMSIIPIYIKIILKTIGCARPPEYKIMNLSVCQALIQYPDVITAQAAKLSQDGQNIYNACCTLRWCVMADTNLGSLVVSSEQRVSQHILYFYYPHHGCILDKKSRNSVFSVAWIRIRNYSSGSESS